MNSIEELFQLDEFELALRVLRSSAIPSHLFPAARREAEKLRVINDNSAVLRLTPAQYLSLRRTVIQSFRMTLLKRQFIDLYQLICIDLEYCRWRETLVGEIATKIADIISKQDIPSEIGCTISVLLLKITSLDSFCACNVYQHPDGP